MCEILAIIQVVDVEADQGGPCRPTCIKIGNRASGLQAMY